MTFTLLPAVDVSHGQAIRLTQGKAGTEESYGSPVVAAQAWQEAGAHWVHLVDLDAAFGTGSNSDHIAEVINNLQIKVELSGGIRGDASLEAALATGCARVNIGTAALENPQWCAEVIARYGGRIAVGLDVLYENDSWRVRARGWQRDGGELWETLERLNQQGCPRYIVTDVSKDGTLAGPNVDLLTQVLQQTDAQVIASGGVSSLRDVEELAGIATPHGRSLEGAIIGKALYAGRFTLPEALAAVAKA